MPFGLAVFLGGLVGTALRLGADRALPHADTGFPLSTLLVNTLGAFALGWLVAGLWTRPLVPQWVKVAVGPGVLGGFTTFSAVMVSLVTLAAAGAWAVAGLYLLVTLGLGFAAATLGVTIGRRLGHHPGRRPGAAPRRPGPGVP